MATPARYCQFCGARLRDEGDPLADHLRDRRECREAFEAWDPAGATVESESERKRRRMRSFLMWIVIAAVLLYAVMIAMDPVLGVLAAGVVYLAFRLTGRS